MFVNFYEQIWNRNKPDGATVTTMAVPNGYDPRQLARNTLDMILKSIQIRGHAMPGDAETIAELRKMV